MKYSAPATCALLFFILHPSFFILAQDATPSPSPDKRGVQLEFAPPPMENATVSMGVYDSTGKLVRVLHQDAPTTDLFPALNGLITFWDGKDDSGKLMPAGKYRAKGYMIGEMDFEGVAFLGNDFVDKDGKVLLHRIQTIFATKNGNCCVVEPQVNGNLPPNLSLDASGNAVDDQALVAQQKFFVKAGAIFPSEMGLVRPGWSPFPGIGHPVAICDGRDGTFWVIDGTDVKQIAADGQLLRHLAAKADDPPPVQIEASPVKDEIFLLEQNDKMQRVRGLALISGTEGNSPSPSPGDDASQKTSVWKVAFTKTIIFSDKIEQVGDLLKMTDGKLFVPQDKIALSLRPNPLDHGKQGAVDIGIGIDAKGSFIKAADGLPLCRVSETPNLKWAAMAREADGKTITVFQSDGAVIEQFKVTNLGNMMAFDAGDFDFDPAKMK